MARKSGKSRILNLDEKCHVLKILQYHRYPQKNRAIFGLSFYLGLKAQTIAGLKIGDIAKPSLCKFRTFDLKESLILPIDFVKSRQDVLRQHQKYQRRYIRMSLEQFEDIVERIKSDFKLNSSRNYMEYLPSIKPPKNSIERTLPLKTDELSPLLKDHLNFIENMNLKFEEVHKRKLELTDPLFITQKGGHYSPNTLQDHMGMVLKKWAGFDNASSHSGRRSFVKEMFEDNEESIDSIQTKIGYRSAATILNYK